MSHKQSVIANRVTFGNSVTGVTETEICNDERLAWLKGMPFIHIQHMSKVNEDPDLVCDMGGITPKFRRAMESIGNRD